MIVQLTPHPDFLPSSVTSIEVAIVRGASGRLSLHYLANGRIGDVLVPEPAPPERTDELWRHTCFEVFVRQPGSDRYFEFNFSPSTRWAAYAFTGYREGMRPADVSAPMIGSSHDHFVLDAAVSADIGLPPDTPLLVAITAIIEERGGAKSYWALKHPPGKPDFHHADGFALELPAGSRA